MRLHDLGQVIFAIMIFKDLGEKAKNGPSGRDLNMAKI